MTETSTPTFLRACRREPVDHTPVWFMRQAGRYMAEYRRLREKYSMLELCSTPELATEVTLQPVRALDIDAAILFSDLLPPLIPMGLDLEYVKGDGPVIHNPVRSAADVERLRPVVVAEDLNHTLEAVRLIVAELDRDMPLIGFAGAPFTLASYAIEGGTSRHHILTKRFMYEQPDAWHALLDKLADLSADLLTGQVEAGARAVQLFDSWVGHLGASDYQEYVLPHSRKALRRLEALGVPVIHFGVGTGGIIDLIREAGGTVIGADWRTPLDDAWRRIGHDVGVQGNLDPVTLFAPRPILAQRVHQVLDQAGGRPGHIFNLGHGILPDTPVDNVKYVVDLVREYSHSASGT